MANNEDQDQAICSGMYVLLFRVHMAATEKLEIQVWFNYQQGQVITNWSW